MDVVHHGVIGEIGFAALAAQQQELAGLGFLAGSVFPDLDVAFIAGGKRFYLKQHQGPTHSLPLAPIYAAALALIPTLQIGWSWALFAGLVAGLAGHVLLDLFNTFGIQIGWPFTRRRFCFDAVFFIDAFAWALSLGAVGAILTGLAKPVPVTLAYVLIFAAYCLARLVLQRRVKARTGADFAIPSAWNPFGFFLFSRRDGKYETARYSALSGRISDARAIAEPQPEVLALARRSPVFRDMESILRGLKVTRMETNNSGTTLTAADLVVRNFGGRFGRTELRFDQAGKLVHEMAHI